MSEELSCWAAWSFLNWKVGEVGESPELDEADEADWARCGRGCARGARFNVYMVLSGSSYVPG